MFCIKCGEKLNDDAKFCIKCGTKVEKVEVAGEYDTTPNTLFSFSIPSSKSFG